MSDEKPEIQKPGVQRRMTAERAYELGVLTGQVRVESLNPQPVDGAVENKPAEDETGDSDNGSD